jgi:uncharacterized protein YbjT (DUF2867 family)
VALRALTEAPFAGADFVLTGPEALSHARQVEVIGEVLGRRLAFHELSPEDFRRETAATWPPSAVEMLLAAWGAAVGHPAYVTTTVADLTGGRRGHRCPFAPSVKRSCSSWSNVSLIPSYAPRDASRASFEG